MVPRHWDGAPKSGSEYDLVFEHRLRAFWHRFWGSGLDFRRFVNDFSGFLAYFGHVFGCSCCGGYAPQRPPILTGISRSLERAAANFVKTTKNQPKTKPRIQERAEDKAENKIRTNAFRKTQIPKLSFSKLPSLPQPSELQKLWAAILPPGGFNKMCWNY